MTHKSISNAVWNRFKETVKERARLGTFEGRIERLEIICQQTPSTWPNRPIDVPPEERSQAWYAEEILRSIRLVRHNLQQGNASHAAAEALIVGVLAAEAGMRLKWQEIQRWLKGVDSESKEGWLTGEVISTVSLAGQISAKCSDKRYGLDMEIELKDNGGKPTGKRLYLQLKSGDSYLKRRKRDGVEVFRVRHKDHAAYWMNQPGPVFLVIANSRGEIRWMEIRDYIKREADNGEERLRQIIFTGERFSVESILRWRDQMLSIQRDATLKETGPHRQNVGSRIE